MNSINIYVGALLTVPLEDGEQTANGSGEWTDNFMAKVKAALQTAETLNIITEPYEYRIGEANG